MFSIILYKNEIYFYSFGQTANPHGTTKKNIFWQAFFQPLTAVNHRKAIGVEGRRRRWKSKIMKTKQNQKNEKNMLKWNDDDVKRKIYVYKHKFTQHIVEQAQKHKQHEIRRSIVHIPMYTYLGIRIYITNEW